MVSKSLQEMGCSFFIFITVDWAKIFSFRIRYVEYPCSLRSWRGLTRQCSGIEKPPFGDIHADYTINGWIMQSGGSITEYTKTITKIRVLCQLKSL